MFDLNKNYMELFFVALMVIGLLIALASPSAFISYIIAVLAGIFAGRVIYERKGKIKLPFFMIIVGFVIGYLIGVYYGNRRTVIVLFVIGAVLGHRLYDKGILKDTRF